MAQAGFIWTRNRLEIQCFSCQLVVTHPYSNNNLWKIHARESPKCIFLRLKRNDAWIKYVRENLIDSSDDDGEEEEKLMTTINKNDKSTACCICFENRIGYALL